MCAAGPPRGAAAMPVAQKHQKQNKNSCNRIPCSGGTLRPIPGYRHESMGVQGRALRVPASHGCQGWQVAQANARSCRFPHTRLEFVRRVKLQMGVITAWSALWGAIAMGRKGARGVRARVLVGFPEAHAPAEPLDSCNPRSSDAGSDVPPRLRALERKAAR